MRGRGSDPIALCQQNNIFTYVKLNDKNEKVQVLYTLISSLVKFGPKRYKPSNEV